MLVLWKFYHRPKAKPPTSSHRNVLRLRHLKSGRGDRCQALAFGLLRYVDNIADLFAHAGAMFITAVVSYLFFELEPSVVFCTGGAVWDTLFHFSAVGLSRFVTETLPYLSQEKVINVSRNVD